MHNPESPAKDSAAPGAIPLHRAVMGLPVVLDAILGAASPTRVEPDDLAAILRAEGLVPGVEITPERRLPMGGPVVVRIGHARVALGRDIARRVLVRDIASGIRAGSGR